MAHPRAVDPHRLHLPARTALHAHGGHPRVEVALTPALAAAFRAAYVEAAIGGVRDATDYREARAARDALADLGATYFAYMEALKVALAAPDVRPEVAREYLRGVLLSPLAFAVPLDEADDAVGRRVAYGAFARARTTWSNLAWRAASRAFDNLELYARNLPRLLRFDLGPGAGAVVAKANTGRKRNSAVARRHERREVVDVGQDEWGYETRSRRVEEIDTPAHVTADHWNDPAVIEARALAEALRWEHNTLLGVGNFGVAYHARGRDGAPPKVVKMPAAHNMHGQPWGRDAQRHNLLHEAGVANELAALGYAVVPRGVYTEWDGGTPTFVREYGEPVTTLTPAEYGALEAELLSIEQDQRWRVEDDLQLYRRPDGSVFVGDVGVWQAPSGHTKTWSDYDSSLRHKLEEVQQKYLPGLAERAPGPHPPREGYEYVLRIPVATLPGLADAAKWVAEAHAKGAERYEGKGGAFLRKNAAQSATRFLDALAARDGLGVPTPAALRAVAPSARALLAFDPDAGARKPNRRPRRAPRRRR